MTAWLAWMCRAVLASARRIVPAESRAIWDEAWQSDYWHWLLKADAHRSADGRSALVAHTADALRAAFSAATGSPENIRRREYITGHPAFPPLVLVAALAAVVVWSGGMPETRQLIQPPTLPKGNNLVLVSQSGKYLAARKGFTAHEVSRIVRQAKTVTGIAHQQWYRASISIDGEARQFAASNAGPRFFDVLGVKPAFGRLPAADDEFLASHAFWRDELREAAIGTTFKVAGRTRRLTGVFPKEFLFLSPIAIWTAQTADAPPPEDKRLMRWYGLMGVIARVKPGVSTAAVERELRDIQSQRTLGHYTQEVHAAPYANYTSRILRMYGGGFGMALMLALIAVVVLFVKDMRAGAARSVAVRYWGLMLSKVMLSIALCFLTVMETTGVNQQGMLGGVWFGRDLFAIWIFFCGSVLLSLWAWRDQGSRCRVCLNRLRDPIRIGVPGQVLLDTTGLELICPKGHGILYAPESVLGSEMSDHWLGLEEPAEK